MCGIVGIIEKVGFPSKLTQSVFEQMLYADALRGWDATGVFSVNHNGDIKTRKKATDASSFFTYLHEDKNEFNLNVPVLIGHNRAATKGSRDNDDHAHPFTEKHITLVHNGTLLNHKELADVEVDSHAITHFLTENTTQELIHQLTGAYALCWYNQQDKTVNILRNDQRPLTILETKHTYIISSEEYLAKWILERNDVRPYEVINVTPNVQYTFKKEKNEIKLFTNTLEKKKAYYPQDSIALATMKRKLLGYGISEQSEVTLKVTGVSQGSKNSWFKHFAEIIGTNFKATFWNDISYEGKTVKGIIGNIYEDGSSIGIYCNTISPIEKRNNVSVNGVDLSPNVKKFIMNRNCASCGKPLSMEAYPESFVEILEYNDVVYGYSVYCPSCTNKVPV